MNKLNMKKQDVKDEIEQAIKRGGNQYANAFIEGMKHGYSYKLQALKEEGEKFFNECWHMDKDEFLNLISKVEP